MFKIDISKEELSITISLHGALCSYIWIIADSVSFNIYLKAVIPDNKPMHKIASRII